MCWSCLVVGGGWTFHLITSTHRIGLLLLLLRPAHTKPSVFANLSSSLTNNINFRQNNHSIPTRLLHSTATGSANYDWLAGAYQNRHETPVLKNPIKIIYIDDDLLVLDKPCSLPVSTPTLCFVPVCP